jgi:hypothetical protein
MTDLGLSTDVVGLPYGVNEFTVHYIKKNED